MAIDCVTEPLEVTFARRLTEGEQGDSVDGPPAFDRQPSVQHLDQVTWHGWLTGWHPDLEAPAAAEVLQVSADALVVQDLPFLNKIYTGDLD